MALALHWPTALAAFLASLVEFVEALTIVLAVGAVRGWRPALAGAGAAALVLTVLVLAFGPSLTHWNVPAFKLVIGTLLLLFGLRWLRKAILRAGGALALHDEGQAFAKETDALRAQAPTAGAAFDLGAATASFNGVFIEGVEVVFIVLAIGAAGGSATLLPASLGAGAAALLVIGLGVAARQPLTRVPENALKMAVGVLVSAFGTFWTGEGLELQWPGGDWATIALALGYLAVAGVGVALVRSLVTRSASSAGARP